MKQNPDFSLRDLPKKKPELKAKLAPEQARRDAERAKEQAESVGRRMKQAAGIPGHGAKGVEVGLKSLSAIDVVDKKIRAIIQSDEVQQLLRDSGKLNLIRTDMIKIQTIMKFMGRERKHKMAVHAKSIDLHVKDLRGMLSRLNNSQQKEKQFVQRLIAKLQEIRSIADTDPSVAAQRNYENPPKSQLGKLAKPARLLLAALGAGMATASLIVTRGKFTGVTALYLGTTYLAVNGGLPKGAFETRMREIGFLGRAKFQKLSTEKGIVGKQAAEDVMNLANINRKPALRKLFAKVRRGDSGALRELLDGLGAKEKSPLRKLSTQEFYYLYSNVNAAKSKEAKLAIQQWIEHRVSSRSLAELEKSAQQAEQTT